MIAGHAFVQNLRRGHDELAVEEPVIRRVAVHAQVGLLAARGLLQLWLYDKPGL